MSKCYLINRADGGVSILYPTDEATEETIVRDAQRVVGYLDHQEIDLADLPEDQTFRNAWKKDISKAKRKITYDYDKAREIVRTVRNKALEALDKKAFTAGRKKDDVELAAIDAEAQRLRDIPQQEDFSKDDVGKLKALYESAIVAS